MWVDNYCIIIINWLLQNIEYVLHLLLLYIRINKLDHHSSHSHYFTTYSALTDSPLYPLEYHIIQVFELTLFFSAHPSQCFPIPYMKHKAVCRHTRAWGQKSDVRGAPKIEYISYPPPTPTFFQLWKHFYTKVTFLVKSYNTNITNYKKNKKNYILRIRSELHLEGLYF